MPVLLEHLLLFTFIKYLEIDSNKLNKKISTICFVCSKNFSAQQIGTSNDAQQTGKK